MAAALLGPLAAASMDDSRHSVRSGGTSVASENFYATNDWDPAPSPAKNTAAPKATLRVLGRESVNVNICLLYTSPSPRDKRQSRMPSSA